MKTDNQRALFVIASFIFLVDIASFVLYGSVSKISLTLSIFISITYIAYATIYLANEKSAIQKRKYLFSLFTLFVALVFLAIIFDIVYLGAPKFSFLSLPIQLLVSVPLFLPFILPIFLARNLYIQKVQKNYEKKVRTSSYIIYLAAIIIFIILFLSGLVFKPSAVHLNDEEFFTLNAANVYAKGQNPYAANFSSILRSNLSKTVISFTLTNNNTIIGVLSYPALSFLLFVPFALANNSGIYHFTYEGFYVLFAIFSFILVVTVSYVLKEDYIKRPQASVIIFLLLFVSYFSSINNFIMLALVIIAIYKIESKYLWIILGILASFQEEVWVLVILFLVYLFRNYGLKRGLYCLFGTMLIFIMINGYFIMLSPSAFFKNILSTANGSVLPNPYAVFGYSILKLSPSALNGSAIFFTALIAIVVAFAYFNTKRLILLFGLLPLMFLSNGIPAYYIFFISALVISLYIDIDRTNN